MKVMDQPRARDRYTRARLEILCCLMERANEPVDLAELSNMIGLPLDLVEVELDELEGPIGASHGLEGAYVHRARCSLKAVYIS